MAESTQRQSHRGDKVRRDCRMRNAGVRNTIFPRDELSEVEFVHSLRRNVLAVILYYTNILS